MNLAEIEPDSMALRLAEVVNRRVGLRPADAVRKVASSLACVDGAYRLAYAERMIAASPRGREAGLGGLVPQLRGLASPWPRVGRADCRRR